MKRYLAFLALIAFAGCADKDQPAGVAVATLADRLNPTCYTVDLFDPFTLEKPAPDVPPETKAFLGVWKHGAWNGQWCHDLYVTRVGADGNVEVLDAYGPYSAAGIEATVFKRKGRIKDGVLTFHSQGGTVEYRLDGEYLVGTRKGTLGNMEITMSRQDDVAVGKPVKLARHVVKKS